MRKATSQTTRVDGKRVVIRTSAAGKVSIKDAPIKESEGQAAQVRALRSLPEYGRQFLLAGDMNSAKRGPRAQAEAIATGLTPGEADLRIYIKGGVLRMIENKVGKGRLSKVQVERHAGLARLGFTVEVVRFTSTAEAASKAVALVKGWMAANDNDLNEVDNASSVTARCAE